MDLTPKDTGFDMNATIKAAKQWQAGGSIGPNPLPSHIGTVAQIVGSAGMFPGSSTPGVGSGLPGDGTPPDAKITLDWKGYLADWGFPPEVTKELDRIFKTYGDAQSASGAATAYIRGTDWYQTTFPGINEGIKKGLISNEQDYRSYVNAATGLYKRFTGQDVSSDQIATALKNGDTTATIGARLEGNTWAQVHGRDAQYALSNFGHNSGVASQEELQALGQQQSGLTNTLGMQLEDKLAKAQQRMKTIFEGTLATPALGLATGRLSATSLLGGQNPDYGS